MREFLTGLAILIIGVLFAALIAPFVVDFNDQRARIEDLLSTASGRPVSIAGKIDIRLLPFPVLKLDQVTIGAPPSRSSAYAERVSLDIATMPLLKGEVHVMEALVEKPVVTVAIAPDGSLAGLAQPAMDEQSAANLISIERLNIKDGQFIVLPAAGAAPSVLSKLDLEVTAASLQGPWRVDGTGEWVGQPVTLRLSTGTADEAGKFRVKAGMDHPKGGFKVDVDGTAGFQPHLTFDGKLAMAGDMAWPEPNQLGTRPWSVSTLARLDGLTLDLSAAEINAGSEEGGFKLNGSGSGRLSNGGSMVMLFDAKQIDLDRPLHAEGKPIPALPVVLGAWRSALLASDEDLRPQVPVELTITVDSVIAGGDTIKGLKLDTKLDSGGVTLKHGEALLPGNAKLSAAGEIGLSEGGAFSGHASFSSKEFGRFGGWVDGQISGRSMRYGEAHEMSAEADLALSSTLIGASNLKIMLDQSSITGLVRYALPDEGQRGRLDAQLASDGFDLDQLPEASLVAARFGEIDASVVINARNVRAPRMKDAHAGRLQMKATASEDGLVIDTLDISDIGGANVRASGRLTSAGDRVEALIDARDVGPIAVLLRKIIPGTMANLLADRAKLLGPANFRVSAERGADKARTIALSFDGKAAGTSLSGAGHLTVDDADTALDGTIKTASTDAGLLLRQLGVSVLPLPLDGGGKLVADVKGSWAKGFALGVKGDLGGAVVSADLKFDPTLTEAKGPIRLTASDAQPLMQALALPVPDLSFKIPVSLAGSMNWNQTQFSLDQLDLQIADRRVTGHLSYPFAEAKIGGELSADQLSLPGLASFVLGPIGGPTAGGIWPSTRFSPPRPPPVDAEITLLGKSFDTGFGVSAGASRMVVVWQPDNLEIRQFQADVLKGKLAGSLAVRRNSGLGSYLGKFVWTGLSIAELLPKSGLSGTADLEFDAGGSGESLAGFATSLSGGGSAHAHDLVLPGFDVSAVGQATIALDNERDPPDPKRVNDMIAARLLANFLKLADIQAPLTATNGVMRIGPVEAHTGGALIQSSLSLDLRNLRLDGRTSLTADQAPKDWAGPQPQANVGIKGLLGGLFLRDVDAATLANILTTRLVTRELARLEAQEADLRERAFFARRLKYDRERAEMARKAADEARLAEETRKADEARAEEDARKKVLADEAAKQAAIDLENKKILDDLTAQKQADDNVNAAKKKAVLEGVDQLLKGNAADQVPVAP